MKRSIVVLLVFFVLTLALTYPLPWHASDAVQDHGDPLLNTWILAWDAHALITDPLRLFDANIFHPHRGTLAYSEHMLASALLAAPVQWASGNPILAYNFVLFISFILSGFGMYLLIRQLTRSDLAGLVAGSIFAFCAYRFNQLSHLQLLTTQWLPFALLYLDQIAYGISHISNLKSQISSVLLFALFFVLQALSSFYYAFFAALVIVLYIACAWLTDRRTLNRDVLVRLALAVMLAAVVIIPLSLPYFAAQHELGFERTLTEAEAGSASIDNYLSVAPRSLLYANLLPHHQPDYLFPGFVALILAVVALATVQVKSRLVFPLVLIAFAVWMSLGPVAGLYRLFYEFLPGFKAMRVPSRFGALAILGMAMLAGLGMGEFGRRLGRRERIVGLALAALIVLESIAIPIGAEHIAVGADIPPVYRWLAAQPPSVVLEIPMGEPPWGTPLVTRLARYQYFSTYHWDKTVNGYSGFMPFTYGELVGELRDFPSGPTIALAQGLGIGYVIVHADQLDLERWQAMQTRSPAFEPTLKLVQQFGNDFVYAVAPPTVHPDVHTSAFLPNLARLGQPYTAFVVLRNPSAATPMLRLTRDVSVTAEWLAISGQRSAVSRQIDTPLVVAPGITVVPIMIDAPTTSGDHRLTLRSSNQMLFPTDIGAAVQVVESVTATQAAVPVQLAKSRLERNRYVPGERMFIDLEWHVLAQMGEDYTTFVHLVDAEGRMVAQGDSQPLRGLHPTSNWLPGEIVPDTYAIPIPYVPGGVYRIEVGLYRRAGLQRITVLDPGGQPTTAVTLSQVKIAGALAISGPTPQHALRAALGYSITLLGYDVASTTVKPGESLRLTLYWQARRTMDRDYTVFVHLLDSSGHIVAQRDSPPQAGRYPTSLWDAGEVIADSCEITIPRDIAPGEYPIEVGMYFLPTLERLPVANETGQPLGDRVLLESLRVER